MNLNKTLEYVKNNTELISEEVVELYTHNLETTPAILKIKIEKVFANTTYAVCKKFNSRGLSKKTDLESAKEEAIVEMLFSVGLTLNDLVGKTPHYGYYKNELGLTKSDADTLLSFGAIIKDFLSQTEGDDEKVPISQNYTEGNKYIKVTTGEYVTNLAKPDIRGKLENHIKKTVIFEIIKNNEDFRNKILVTGT